MPSCAACKNASFTVKVFDCGYTRSQYDELLYNVPDQLIITNQYKITLVDPFTGIQELFALSKNLLINLDRELGQYFSSNQFDILLVDQTWLSVRALAGT